jgi:hypothetical protein|tara:strand:+ start:666 stop:1397 length:732 start_codon:yes stop_codon:yes gene_type:complete
LYRYVKKTRIAIIVETLHVLKMKENFNLSYLENYNYISLITMDVQYLYDKVKPIIDLHRNDEHVEIEIRLGKFNGKMFDTNVGKEPFTAVMRRLQKYTGWEKIMSTSQEVFYRETDNTRITIDENTGEETVIQKHRVHNEDFKNNSNTPFDFRVSISKETPVADVDRTMDKKKMKERLSFIRKNLSIDLTTCMGDTHDMDSEDPVVYQIEMEIIDPKTIGDDRQLFNILHKVKDLFNILDTTK